MKPMMAILAIVAATDIVSCQGQSEPAFTLGQSYNMTYTDPNPVAGEWALYRDNQTSTGTHLVLNLVGPKGALFRGIGFDLQADTSRVRFSTFQDSNGRSLGYMLDNRVIHDLDDTAHPIPCMTSAAGVKADTLSVGLFQSGVGCSLDPRGSTLSRNTRSVNDAVDCSTFPVLKVALDLVGTAASGPVSLKVTKAAIVMDKRKHMDRALTATVRVGSLTLTKAAKVMDRRRNMDRSLAGTVRVGSPTE